jgi:hypothetical protein
VGELNRRYSSIIYAARNCCYGNRKDILARGVTAHPTSSLDFIFCFQTITERSRALLEKMFMAELEKYLLPFKKYEGLLVYLRQPTARP